MKNNSAMVLCLAMLMLSGCGDTTESQSNGDGNAVAAASGSVAPPANWMATDACAVIDKAAMAAIVGQPVVEASLALVHDSDGTTAATSKCYYKLNDGTQADLMMRWSPIADNTEGAMNLARNGLQETLKAFNKSLETMDGLGKAAFWADIGLLNVFIGEDKFVIISMPTGPQAKDHAIALARKLGA